MTSALQRYQLELDAHSIDYEFENKILKDYDVKIIDRSGEPWSVMFEGPREQLLAMVFDLWGDHMDIADSEFIPVHPSSKAS